MVDLIGVQDKVLTVLRQYADIVERRRTLPCLANAVGGMISNGFPEQGGGGAAQVEAEADASGCDGAPDAASDDDDDGDGDSDPDSDRRRPRSKTPPSPFPPALLPFAHLSHYVTFGRSRIYQLINAGEFPKPIKLGKSSRWLKTEIDLWIQQHAAQRAGS